MLSDSWRDTCLNQLKTTLIVVFSSGVTEKTYPTIPLWLWISYRPLPHRHRVCRKSFSLYGDLNAWNRNSMCCDRKAWILKI